VVLVVVAEDGEFGLVRGKRAEEQFDPRDVFVRVHEIAREHDEVRRGPAGFRLGEHGLEERLRRRAVEVEVSEVENREAVPRLRQLGQPQREVREVDFEGAGEGNLRQPPPLAPADGGGANRLPIITCLRFPCVQTRKQFRNGASDCDRGK
jgi:hypothetical protein